MAENEIQQRWINTPFAYTRLSKNLSLLQQDVLIKVSAHMQKYIQEFYGSELKNSREKPQALLSEAVKNSGISQFHISYAELGVEVNNYYAAQKAVSEVLKIQIDAPGVDKDGRPAIIKYNVFTQGNMSSENSNGVVFGLNMDLIKYAVEGAKPKHVVDYVFDMTDKYVRHPDDIARQGKIERMPMMYYLLQHETQGWNRRQWNLTVEQIKRYLGMIEENEHGERIKEAYPKFSQFKKNVLDTSIADINRLRQEGLLDVCVSYEPVYNGKRKVGNPAFIKFCIYDTIEEMQKASGTGEPVQQNIFADQTTKQPNSQPTKQLRPGEAEWLRFLATYNGVSCQHLRQGKFQIVSEQNEVVLRIAQNRVGYINRIFAAHSEEEQHVNEALSAVYGKSVTLKLHVG